ncbi:hypothetical protein BGZ98_007663 [Dissophora globulifera]|uniref:Uncharacterized protein n=1 Tax=Dissophora globulifera TaxID=979702 RepID=A0A9P6UWQ2_9FUNG|nr:hypothetical protein BGZ98_007663 [Dissophora globulifera]KAG0323092.1 hypothetical protein BGZ99_002931 [Dissophora globulifera]
MESQAPPRMSASMSRTAAGGSASQGSLLNTHTNSGSGDTGHYIPPTSDLTSSDHDKALGVIDAAFKQTDRIIDERDMKAFGDNSESIFQELNKIRKKQLALAAKHISIETVTDDDKSLAPDGRLLDAADKDEIDPLQFARKGQELQELMASLEDLGRSMSDFHELSNSTNK